MLKELFFFFELGFLLLLDFERLLLLLVKRLIAFREECWLPAASGLAQLGQAGQSSNVV